jgi:HK97 family phage portal protein
VAYNSITRQRRARYARTNSNFLINDPDGFPSGMEPVTMWWWGDDSPLVFREGHSLAAVTRATSIIVNTLSSLPWRLLKGVGSGPRTSQMEMPDPRWVTDPCLLRPDGRFPFSPMPSALRMPAPLFWAQWVRSSLLRGMGYLIFEFSDDGSPIPGTMRVLNPQSVGSQYDHQTGLVHRRIGDPNGRGEHVDTDFDGQFVLGGRVYQLLELVNPTTPVDEHGVAKGVLETHAAELEMAQRAVSYGSGMYRSGVPAGYLKTTTPNFREEQAIALRKQWLSHHGGDRRSIAVLNSTTDFQPIQMSPVDMAIVQMRQMSVMDIANMFGVPIYFLGSDPSSSNTYSNAESRNQDLRQSLLHWAAGIEQTLSSCIPNGQWIEIDFRGLLRPDTKTRYESYSMALRDKWLTVDEVRQLENLPPLPEQPGTNSSQVMEPVPPQPELEQGSVPTNSSEQTEEVSDAVA